MNTLYFFKQDFLDYLAHQADVYHLPKFHTPSRLLVSFLITTLIIPYLLAVHNRQMFWGFHKLEVNKFFLDLTPGQTADHAIYPPNI